MGPADEHHPPDNGAPPARAEPGLAGRARYPLCFLVVRLRRPLVDQAAGSFFNWYDIHPASFAGFHYYGEVLADPMASAALVHTAIYVGVAVPVEVVLGVAGAWLVYRATARAGSSHYALHAPARGPLGGDGNAVFRPPPLNQRGPCPSWLRRDWAGQPHLVPPG